MRKTNSDTIKSQDEITLNISKDKLITYLLIVLILTIIIIGYVWTNNKNQANNANVQGANTNLNNQDMSSHHGGGNKKFEPLNPGITAPAFSLPSTSGKTVTLSNYKGKNIFLFFNEGVMCSPCWQEISRLERFKDDFNEINTVIIPISVDDQKTWDPILKEEKITTPILIDADRKVTSLYKALGTPSSMHEDRAGHTYVHINPEGKVHSSADFPNMNVPANILIQHIKEPQKSTRSTNSWLILSHIEVSNVKSQS